MRIRVVAICFLVLAVLALAMWLNREEPTQVGVDKPVEPVDRPAAKAGETEKSGQPQDVPPPRRVVRCPVSKPAESVDVLKDVIADSPESLLQQFKELERLQAKSFDPAAADWLRWMIHQDERHETLRNEAGKVLLNWNPEWLVGDLAGMMEDPAQSETWRNYCVQHLWAHRTKYKDDASLKAIERAANSGSAGVSDTMDGTGAVPRADGDVRHTVAGGTPAVQGDWVIRSQAVFSLANIANEEKWKDTQPQRMADLSAKLKQAIQTAKAKGYSHGPSAQIKYDTPEQKAKASARIQKFQITSEDLESAFVSVQMLELKDLAPEAEAFAGDESNDLAVRTAAVRALITVGRPESVPILEKCAASEHRVLAKMAALALKPLKSGIQSGQ